MAISKRVRYEVMRRDGHACRYCGAMAPEVKLTIDHVMPTALGGDDQPTNLVTACAACNAGKSSSAPDAALVAEVAEADLRLAAAMRQAAEEIVAKADGAQHAEYVAIFHALWGEFLTKPDSDIPLPRDWRKTVASWADAGLPEELLAESVHIAMGAQKVSNENVFRYLCGIVKNRITEIRTRAAEIMAEQRAEMDA